MMDFKNNYIQYRLERVKETFEEAKTMANMGHWNTCVNRLYYTCFYAVNALLLKYNFSSAKHTGVRALLNRQFIKTGKISKELGELYNSLFLYRQQSDYEDLFRMDKEIARSYIEQTKAFIEKIENLIQEN